MSRVRRLDYEIIKDYEVINRRHVYCEQVKTASSVPPFTKNMSPLVGLIFLSKNGVYEGRTPQVENLF